MANITLLEKELKRTMQSFDFEKAIASSDNEAKTRMYLVEPFFEMLRYNRGFEDGNLIPEYDADFADLKGKKVDYAIRFRKKPEILIEVKKAGQKLTDKHLRQLNEYFIYLAESKIGILTNGIEYQFFCRNINGNASLHPTPFFTFNFKNFEGDSFEKLARFHQSAIEIRTIIEGAQKLFFIESFEEALYKEFANPSREFIRSIYSKMNGSRLNESTENQIRELIYSVSIKSALDRLIVEEANKINSGIITTDMELKIFHVIKTILAQNKQIDTDSIGYRDFKGKFSIILEDNQKKKICNLFITSNSQKIEIDGEKFDIPDIDSIIKHKKKLIDKAILLAKE